MRWPQQSACPHESDVIAAVHSGRWSSALRAHVTTCGYCADAVRWIRRMQQLAETTPEPVSLPDPTVIWWKARLFADMESSEPESILPHDGTRWVTVMYTILLVGMIGLFLHWWPEMQSTLYETWADWITPFLSWLDIPLVPKTLILTAIGLTLSAFWLATMVTIDLLTAEE